MSALGSGRCNYPKLLTTFSPIRIALPEDACLRMNARTWYGKIFSGLPTAPSREGSQGTLIAEIRQKNRELRLNGSTGHIQILKTPGAGKSDRGTACPFSCKEAAAPVFLSIVSSTAYHLTLIFAPVYSGLGFLELPQIELG